MNLPSPQYSRLVTALAFDLSDPSLDSMILAWDHIAKRFLDRIRFHRIAVGRIESIRLLAVHDAIHAVFGSGGAYIYKKRSGVSSAAAALVAAARASHDVLAAAFPAESDREELATLLEESLSLTNPAADVEAGSLTGERAASAYLAAFDRFIREAAEVVDTGGHAAVPIRAVEERRWLRSA